MIKLRAQKMLGGIRQGLINTHRRDPAQQSFGFADIDLQGST
jgi:hypothetical protein